ncbi:MAG: SIMPL domain-containing protein [Actinomycetota bacterium]
MQVSVVGEQAVRIPPERGELHLTAGFEGEDKGRVVEATVDLVGELSAEIEELTSGEGPASRYTVGPLQTRSWRPQNELGQVLPLRYSASVPVMVRFEDFDELSRFASRCAARNGLALGHVEWQLTETTLRRTRETASAAAVVHARSRALVMAKAAGFTYVMPNELADPGLLIGSPPEGARPLETVRAEASMGGGGQIDPDAIDLRPDDIVVTAVVHGRFTAG